MDKRTFLKSSALMGLGSAISFGGMAMTAPPEPEPADFWGHIRNLYDLPKDFINLENGYYCVQPRPILEKYVEHIKAVNVEGAHYLRTVQFDNKKAAATRLAKLAGVADDELIITRNTTESLDMIIAGMNWQPGDEAIMATTDYGAMMDMFKQVSKRYGMVNKTVNVPLHPMTDDEIVEVYARAITPKTRLLMVCHIINITGQVLPVRKICDMAHAKNVPVMVDGAHAFAHLDFKIPDLHCDYYGCSLHKWLSVPLGAGLLYMNKAHIPEIWPIFAEGGKSDTDILRLNHTGTHPVATDLTIGDAIDFYVDAIGPQRKEERLRFLQRYWTDKVRGLPKVVMNTPTEPERTCAIANIGIKGLTPKDMATTLMGKYKIFTVAIDTPDVQGCRITPNVYTTTGELDAFVAAIMEMAS